MNLPGMGPRHQNLKGNISHTMPSAFDKWLFIAVAGILAFGLMMVASSSIVISEKLYGQPFHFLIRQSCYLVAGITLGLIVIRIDMQTWQRASGYLLLATLVLLMLVLIPGIGRSVNGSSRWIGLGPIAIQVSELAKLVMILYVASFIARHSQEIKSQFSGFLKPLLVLALYAVLLLKEPDFGAVVVISMTVLGMLFVAGVRLSWFLGLVTLMGAAGSLLVMMSPYRFARLVSFLSPWADQFNGGYQLTQSLIAFGRGGVWGTGLGESVQKLFYLPEAHTDFLFAVLAEELGLIGILVILLLYFILIARGFVIAKRAHHQNSMYISFVAFGITLWLALQVMINIGVNAGLLPTKGLTLPLMSSGGSSLLITCVAIAILFRVDYESRRQAMGLTHI